MYQSSSALVAMFTSVLCSCMLSAQGGLLGNVDKKAVDFLVEFSAARTDLPHGFAVVGQGILDGVSSVSERKLSYIEAQFERAGDSPKRLSVFSIRQGTVQPRFNDSWDQTLTVDGKTYRRHGSPLGGQAVENSEDVDVPIAKSVTRRTTPTFDPFYLTVADVASFLTSTVDSSYGVRLMKDAKLKSAKRNSEGMIEGTWTLGEVKPNELVIAFDEKQGDRPVRAIWSRTDAEKMTIFAVMKTQWHQVDLGGKEKIWIPLEIRRVHISSNGGKQSEYVFRMEWKKIQESDMPNATDVDWRAPFTKMFEIDWFQEFADYQPYHSDLMRR